MPYNPTRMNPGSAKHKVRRQMPGTGKRHGDLLAVQGPQGIDITETKDRETTDRGWKVAYLNGPDLEVFYEFICRNNATGRVRSSDKDRVVRVLGGILFVNIEKDGEINQFELKVGQTLVLNRGVSYELVTRGDLDAEVLFSQSFGYDKSLDRITESVQNSNVEVPIVDYHREDRQSKRPSERAMIAANQLKQERDLRNRGKRTVFDGSKATPKSENIPRVSRNNVNGAALGLPEQTVVGISPMPIGSRGFGDE